MLFRIIKKITTYFFFLVFFPFKHFIPKGNIVVLGTSTRHQYRDNTKYLLEYFAHKNKFKVFWITDNDEVKSYLDNQGIETIGLKSPLKMIWVLLRAKVIVDSGTEYFNPFGLTSSNKTIKLTTLHGNGPKATFSRFHPPDNEEIAIQQIRSYYSFDYINYPSDYSMVSVGRRCHLLPNKKIVSLGYPRCDQYFDDDYINKRYSSKMVAKKICASYSEKDKIIYYTPTWRPYKYEFPLTSMLGLNMIDFNKWLRDRNYFFFYSVHSAHFPIDKPIGLERIIYIDSVKHPFFDVNEFMLEVDILLNDYSTTSTEFAILNRPQIFFMPDYDNYEVEKGFVENYKKLLVGREIASFNEFLQAIDDIETDISGYMESYNKKKS